MSKRQHGGHTPHGSTQTPNDQKQPTSALNRFINDLNARISADGLEGFSLDIGSIHTLNSPTCDDLIYDLSSQHLVNRLAYDYFSDIEEGVTTGALQLACRYNWRDVVESLLQKGVQTDVARVVRTGDAPLIIAASLNLTSLVQLLIKHGANVNEYDQDGRTALHLAAQHGNKDLCELLLQQPDIDVNRVDNGKKTALHLAMLSGDRGKKAASYLIAQGADIFVEDDGGRCALEIAAGEGDHEMINILIASAPKKNRIIQAKIDEALFIAAGSGYEKVVSILVKKGADVNYVSGDREGKLSVIHVAAINGHVGIAKLLVSKNADDNAVDRRKMTPFHRACKNGHLDVVQMELWTENHLQKVDEGGNTPLMLAVQRGRTNVVQYLLQRHLKYNVPFNTVDKEGYNIIHKAVMGQHVDTLRVILDTESPFIEELVNGTDNRHKRSPLHFAAMRDCKLVELLMGSGARVVSDDKGKTPLHIAARYGHASCISLFQEGRSGGELDEVDAKKRHIIHQAAKSKQATLIAGKSIKAEDCLKKDIDGLTPLHYAAKQGAAETMRVIILKFTSDPYSSVGDVVNQVNDKNETSLHLACREGHVECINLLLENGADVSIKTRESKDKITGDVIGGGRTCLDEAVLRNNEKISDLLLNHKTAQDMLIQGNKTVCNINLLIRYYPHSLAAKVLLDKCVVEEEGIKAYLFGVLDKVEDENGRGYFAPSMMEEEHKNDLIEHEVTSQLILHKWNYFGRWLYFIFAMVNAVYSALVTSLMVDLKEITDTFGIDVSKSIRIIRANMTNTTVCNTLAHNDFSQILPIVLLAVGGVYLLTQIIYMIALRTRYINFNNMFRLLIALFTFLYILPYVACHSENFRELVKGQEKWGELQLQFGSIAILLSWINMMMYFRHFFYGIYVIMLLEVLKSWLKSVLVFAILIIGFALSFYCVLDQQKPFRSTGLAIAKVLVWFIGEISYEDLFIEQKLLYLEIATIILFIFFITMNIAFINLLVGLAVGDINTVRKKAYILLLKEKIHSAEILYKILPARVRRYLHKHLHTPNVGCCPCGNRFGNTMMKDLEDDAKERAKEKKNKRRMALRATRNAYEGNGEAVD